MESAEKYIASIDQNGLIPKSRLYVHLSKDVETAKAVGKRHGKEVVYLSIVGRCTKMDTNSIYLKMKFG